jgi:hypothetical protein
VRMAPDDAVSPILGVPLGSVTPLALAHPAASNVVLLLDAKLKDQTAIAVHPLVNTTSTVLSPAGLETYLRSIGREPVYVDLEREAMVGPDNPGDLKPVADVAVPIVLPEEGASTAGGRDVPVVQSGGKGGKAGGKRVAGVGAREVQAGPRPDAVCVLTDALVAKILKDGVNGMAAEEVRRLKADVVTELNGLRNASYAAGFKAAQKAVTSHITGAYS